jgi:predicted ATPase
MADARSRTDVVRAIAGALEVSLTDSAGALAQVGRALAARTNAVLSIDTFETVVAHAGVIAELRAMAPGARVLVTSREPLGIDGEHVVELGPLTTEDSIELLVTRAHERGVQVGGDAALPELAQRLDGIPLALELAAGRLGSMSPAQVVARLDRRMRLLSSGEQSRHGALRAALDWSWDLMAEWERAALAQLSVLAGEFDLDAAEAVLDVAGAPGVLDVAEALVRRSLLTPRTHGPAPRFGLYDTVRDYGALQLTRSEREAAELRHGAHFASLDRVGSEIDNVTIACRRAVARGDGVIAGVTASLACDALRRSGPASAALEIVEHALEVSDVAALQVRRAELLGLIRGRADEEMAAAYAAAVDGGDLDGQAIALRAMGRAESDLLHLDQALAHFETARALSVVAGDRDAEAAALMELGGVQRKQGRAEEAIATYRLALARRREVGNVLGEAHARNAMGTVRIEYGEAAAGEADIVAALSRYRRLGDRAGVAHGQTSLGFLQARLGRPDDALATYREALEAFEFIGDSRNSGVVRSGLATVLMGLGRTERSRVLYEQALVEHEDAGNKRMAALTRANLGLLLHGDGRVDEAADSMRAAIESYRHLGDRLYLATVLTWLGSALRSGSRLREAREAYSEAVELFRAIDNRDAASEVAVVLARLALSGDDIADALWWLNSAASMVEGPIAALHAVTLAEAQGAPIPDVLERIEPAHHAIRAQVLCSMARCGDATAAERAREEVAHLSGVVRYTAALEIDGLGG